MLHHLRRHLGLLASMLATAVALGIAYRYLFNTLEERTLSFYTRSALHGIGMAFAGWTVQMGICGPAALPARERVAASAADPRIRAEGAGDDRRADDRHARIAVRALSFDLAGMVRAGSAAHRRPRVCRLAALWRDF